MNEILGYLIGIILVVGFIPYFRDILKGTTKPERASWLIWSVLTTIAFFSQLASGAGWSLMLTGVDTLVVILIFLLSIKYGVGGVTRRDKLSLVFAAIGLLVWYITNSPTIALVLIIAIDAVGAYLTVYKTYKDPDTETTFSWVMTSIAGFLAIVIVGEWNVSLIIYPLYIFIANSTVVATILIAKYQRKQIEKSHAR